MATPNYAFEKRQRELAKKRKQEEKRQKKQEQRKDDPTTGTPQPGEGAAPANPAEGNDAA